MNDIQIDAIGRIVRIGKGWKDTCAICNKELYGRGTKRVTEIEGELKYICYGKHKQ